MIILNHLLVHASNQQEFVCLSVPDTVKGYDFKGLMNTISCLGGAVCLMKEIDIDIVFNRCKSIQVNIYHCWKLSFNISFYKTKKKRLT